MPPYSPMAQFNIFISFVPPAEHVLRASLVRALSPLSRHGLINLWSDEYVQKGQPHEDEIRTHLQLAQIILLLVSPTCVGSPEWYQQTETIMAHRQSNRALVIPIILRPTIAWQDLSFGGLEPLPSGGRPVTSFTRQDEAWYEIADHIYKIVLSLQKKPVPSTIARQIRTQPPIPHPTMSIARPDLVREIYRRLISPEVSVLILTGIWGIGKSALAAQVCQFATQRALAGESPFSGKALWFDIDETTSLLDVLVTLAHAYATPLPDLQVMNTHDQTVELFTLWWHCQPPRLIVLNQLDNWLHPQTRHSRSDHPEIGELFELLNNHLCASRILCTSRIYPRSSKSQVLEAYVQRFIITGLTRNEGLQMFRLGPEKEEEGTLVSAITHYQGHPMILTLLRNLLTENQSLSLANLLQDIANKQFFVSDMVDHVLHYLYTTYLDQEQRELLLAFAIYRQAVSLQAAQVIALARIDLPSSKARRALQILLQQDLLQATGNDRYRLHPVIREFAQAQMSDHTSFSQEHWQRAHMIAASTYQEPFLNKKGNISPPNMDSVRPLLEAAWHYCQASQQANAYALIHSEQLFLHFYRGGGNSILLELYQLLLPPEIWQAEDLAAAHLYHEMGQIQNALGNKQEALTCFQQTLPYVRKNGQPELVAEVLNDLGIIYSALQQFVSAEDCYREAWFLCEQAGVHFSQRGSTLNNLGRLFYEQGKQKQAYQKEQGRTLYQQALSYYEQALQTHINNNQPEEEGWTLLNLGDANAALGLYSKAQDAYVQALQRFRQQGERRGEGTTLNNLGLLLTHRSAVNEQPDHYYCAAIRIFHATGDRWQERKSLRNLGRWLLIHALSTTPESTQSYLSGLACFFAARDALKEEHTNDAEIIPGWLLTSLGREMESQKLQELLEQARTQYWQLIEALLAKTCEVR